MKAAALLNSRAVVIVAGVAVGALVVYLIGRKVASAVTNINRGTPYQGGGVIGTLGNVTNQASGGLLADFGGWLGGKIFDLTHSEYDPNK